MGAPRYTPAEIDLVMEWYENTPTDELLKLMPGRKLNSVYRLAKLLGLRKSKECIAEVSRRKLLDPNHGARRTCFSKGHVPANKGRKSPGYAPGRMRETQFKKGRRNYKEMPIGSTRKIDGYVYRKVSAIPNSPYTVNWKPEHYLLWEKKRGPVPAGHALIFKDGNRDNIKLRNLQLLTRGELMRRNTVHNLPPELVQVIMLNGALKRKIRNRSKQNAEE